MSAPVEIILAIGIVGFVIARQLIGEPLRGKKVVILPVVLTIIGIANLHSDSVHVKPVDLACLAVGGAVVAGIGIAQAMVMRLESRNGALWGQLPPRGLWLWLLLIISRLIMTLIADSLDAKAAAASSTILLMLGINRLAQAGVIIARGASRGIVFVAEDDGKTILADLMGRDHGQPRSTPRRPAAPEQHGEREREQRIDWNAVGRQASNYLDKRRNR
jgi:hypothetical protein